MKGKFKLLSIVSALLLGATMSLTACGKGGVEEHDHVWNDGEITTEATCHSEGLKTYTCTFDGCGQTKSEPIAKTAHTWNSGEVTKEATCSEEGVKTYTCTVEGCGKTKEEAVDKTEHKWDEGEVTKVPDFFVKGEKTYTCLDCKAERSESLPAHADFAEQFISSVGETNWLYGYTQSFSAETNEAEFVKIASPTNGVWKAEGVEIGKGYVLSEGHAMIAYTFAGEVPAKVQAELAVSFVGEQSATVLKAYLLVLGNDGDIKVRKALNAEGKKDWNYKTEEAVDIAQGYTFWLVFENAGTGKAGGNLTVTLTSPCVHVWRNPGTVKKEASCTEEGAMEYTCINCDVKNTETIEKTPHDYEGVVTREPTVKQNGEMTYTCKVCHDSYTESIPKLTSDKFEGADFAEDFEITDNGEFNGWSVGKVNYDWDNENFTFTKITEKNGAGDAYNDNSNGWKEIKGNWMAVEEMMGFAYHFESSASVTFNFVLAGKDGGKFSVRWALKDKDGNIKTNDGKASWGDIGKDITVTADVEVAKGDVLYILVQKEKESATNQCDFSLVLTNKATEG